MDTYSPSLRLENVLSRRIRFLTEIHEHCRVPGSGLLIGVDAKKDARILEAAYDDPVGVTAAFNRNVLAHVNRLLDANFNPAQFAHRGLYNEAAGRVEMYREAMTAQRVSLRPQTRSSNKYVGGL